MPDPIAPDDLPPVPAPRHDPEMENFIVMPRSATAAELLLYLVIIVVMGSALIVLVWQHTCGMGARC